jgi:hypothetical protein
VTDRTDQAIAAAIADLDWFQIPHTLDQVLGIYAESLGEGRALSKRNLTNDECLQAIRARVGGRAGGHADPTVQAALAGEPDALDDADGTVGAIDACLAQMTAAARELDALVASLVGIGAWNPTEALRGRQDAVALIGARLARIAPHVGLAAQIGGDGGDLELLARTTIAESAAWLRLKGEEIWRASRGDHRPVAVQRAIVECSCCSTWRTGTIARVRGLCDQCATFQGHHRCLPTEPIVRRWEYGKGATPAQVIEAKAARRKVRSA